MRQDLVRFGPELALSATVALVLFADLLLKGSGRRRFVLHGLAVLGVIGAGFALLLLPSGDRSIFSGMLAVDGMARFFKGLFLVVALFGILFGALSDEIPEDRFGEYLLLLLCLTLGLSILSAAQNLLLIYLALELVSLPSYILAGFRRGDKRSSEAALKYVIYGGAASGVMLYGFSLLYGLGGTLDLAGVGQYVESLASQGWGSQLAVVAACLFSLAGFAYKVAAVPFHMWCPDVYEGAPTPFVAFLSVGPKAAGLAALVRFFLVGYGAPTFWMTPGEFPWPLVLGVLAIATMTLGNLVAIAQENIKRMLAYSSIAHAGYMLMGVAVGTSEGVRAVMLYLGIYLAMNLGAFLAVMAVRARIGSESISDYKGLGTRSPYLAALLAIFLFSLVGLPPLGGFIGKFYVFAAVLHVKYKFFYFLALVGVLNSAVSLYYYARVIKTMFLEKPDGEAASFTLAPSYGALLTVLMIPTVALGIWWKPLADAVAKMSLVVR
ncbi:MAG: NADH-quinone oxidoreductase subunit N [Deltaproteobacteria bacterium]|nr:NADH-quinone oxidoreductase subunit N [Deltaproteobacteria bacterium]